MKRLLIISNNVLSDTNNNGKTILSFIRGIKDVAVSQLYLGGEIPKVYSYNYFRISDKDIIRGILIPRFRGNVINPVFSSEQHDDYSLKKAVGRNTFTLLCREALWHNKWMSNQLITWLDDISPDVIFFVAGDSAFAYEICEYIQKRYNSRLSVYITDDYIMPRSNQSWIERKRISKIKRRLKGICRNAVNLFTISELMREEYKRTLGIESNILFNMTEDLLDNSYTKNEKELIFVYTGSFYYKRDEVLKKLAEAIMKYNKNTNKPAKLLMYSNREPNDQILATISINGISIYKGSLNQAELKERINTADFLVFVESFETDQIEKIKYSFSTKVPEYLSAAKPIIAIGPDKTGSMEYLRDVAFCIYNYNEITSEVFNFLTNNKLQNELGKKAREKFLRNHNRIVLQQNFIDMVFGEEGIE